MDPALNHDTIERFAQELLRVVKDAKVSDLRLPLLAPLCHHLCLGVIKADQREFLGMLGHLADDAIGMDDSVLSRGVSLADFTIRGESVPRIFLHPPDQSRGLRLLHFWGDQTKRRITLLISTELNPTRTIGSSKPCRNLLPRNGFNLARRAGLLCAPLCASGRSRSRLVGSSIRLD